MNEGLALLAHLTDILTCGNLDYAAPRGGFDNRAFAAADLVDSDYVQYLGTPGQYRVRSRTVKEPSTSDPVWYRVLVDGEDLHCECMDNFYRGDKPHDPIICVHILAAADREAMRRTWEA